MTWLGGLVLDLVGAGGGTFKKCYNCHQKGH